MAYNEKLAVRVKQIITETHAVSAEKEMFKGLCLMIDDKMCVVIHTSDMMLRINPDDFDTVVAKNGCEAMVMKGKPMKGYVIVQEAVLKTKQQLNYWVQLALAFNKIATASKKKTKK